MSSEIEKTFSTATGRTISFIEDACKKWGPGDVIPEAERYIRYIEQYIASQEQFDETDTFLLDATCEQRMAVRDDSPGLNFEGVDVELGEPASGSPGAPMDSERGHARTETCTALPNPRTSASVPKSILPRKAPTKRNQRVLMHNCLTEVLSGGAEWDPHTVKTIEGKRIFASVSHPERTVAHIVAALDKVEILVDYSVLTRRFLLLCLADARKVIEIEVEQSRYAAGIPPGSRKKESEVLDIMVKQAFPATVQDWGCLAIPTWRTKYDHERNSIKNRLHAAKNWKVANDRFGSGVITLFPAKSCSFEQLDEEHCEKFLAKLKTLGDGRFIRLARERQPNIGKCMS